jgi:putative ABC transport system substrate-binding protein
VNSSKNAGMSKCTICFVLLLSLICAGTAEAQQPKLTKIGWLAEQVGSGRELFRGEFLKLGYIEGKNLVYEYRYSEKKPDSLPALADELVCLQVDVLIANSTAPAIAAKNLQEPYPSFF